MTLPTPSLSDVGDRGFIPGIRAVGKFGGASDGEFGLPPGGLEYQLFVEAGSYSSEGTPATELDYFLGVQPGTLAALSSMSIAHGSAVQRTFTAEAGDVVMFEWNFLTDSRSPDYADYDQQADDDFAFVRVTPGAITKLADTKAAAIPSSHSFNHETGYRVFHYAISQSGTYTLTLGVVDAGEYRGACALLIRDLQVRPATAQTP
jgi:hypothetical protein